MATVTLIIPAYNEAAGIKETIHTVQKQLSEAKNTIKILVVNDGSTDGTGAILRQLDGIEILENPTNCGYGYSLKRGIMHATTDYIMIMDADGTYPSSAIPELIARSKKYDMVVGARTGKNVKIPSARKPAKLFLKYFAEYLTGTKIPDLNSGLRIFRKAIVMRFMKLFPNGFSFTTTLTMLCLTNNYAVDYVPINYHKRTGKSSIHPLKDFIGFTSLIFRLTVFFKPLRVFIPASAIFFSAGVIKLLRDFILLNHFGLGGSLLILTAIQIAFLGIIAELIIARTSL